VIGQFFRQGLRMSGEDLAQIRRDLDKGRGAVGVLTWGSQTEAVTNNLKTLGGTPRSFEGTKLKAKSSR
jgi:hypothetical protein